MRARTAQHDAPRVPTTQAPTAHDSDHAVLLHQHRGDLLAAAVRPSALQGGDVDGLRPLVTGLGVVGDLRALGERLEAVRVDPRVVDEEVLAALVRGDEAEALVVVEPLDGSGCHVLLLRWCELRTRETLYGDDCGR